MTVHQSVAVSEEEQQALAGTYVLANGSTVKIEQEEDGLVLLDSRGAPPAPLYGSPETGMLFARGIPIQVRYVRAGGTVNEIRYRMGNEELTATRRQ